MAGPPCMSNDGNGAVFVGTFLENGDAVALCGECLPGFAIALTASMTGTDVETLTDFLDRQAGDIPPDITAQAAGLAAPPQSAEPPTRGGEPPAVGPADDDQEAGWDFTRPTGDDGPMSNGSSGQPTGTDANGQPPPGKPKARTRTGS